MPVTVIGNPSGALTGGRLRHRGAHTPVDGLYVLGLPWQRTAGSALLGFVPHDAVHLARHLLERHRHGTGPRPDEFREA